jgi:hypothetical protein
MEQGILDKGATLIVSPLAMFMEVDRLPALQAQRLYD